MSTVMVQSDSGSVEPSLGRLAEAEDLIKKSMYFSMGAGLIPLPVVDFVAVSGIQVEMLRRLSKIYDVPFLEEKGKKLLGVLIGGSMSSSLAPVLGELVKFIPIVGPTLSALSMPVVAGASTYAVGKVFIQHFESGGTFLTFDPEAVREYYKDQFTKGKSLASEAAKNVAK